MKKQKIRMIVLIMLICLFVLNACGAKAEQTKAKTISCSVKIQYLEESVLNLGAVEVYKGETVLGMTKYICRDARIELVLDSGGTYITNINGNEAEGEYGWFYEVNGELPSVGAGDYELKDGDEVLWYYSKF